MGVESSLANVLLFPQLTHTYIEKLLRKKNLCYIVSLPLVAVADRRFLDHRKLEAKEKSIGVHLTNQK